MPDSAPGYAARPEDAQCYNCGASGHWAIACPEPTRETPAGLAAWRSTNNMGKGSNNRDQHGGSKKSKGPIITKYAPPPPPGPTVNRYGPPPGYGQPSGPYPGSAPPFPPQYPPHSAPIPNYAPSYPPQSYPPQPYPPPPYGNPPHSALPPGPPPGPYGLPPHPHLPPHPSHPSHQQRPPHPPHPPHQPHPPHPPHQPHLPHPPHPAGSPSSYPPAYGPPPTTQPPQQYGSQPPYGSSYPQPYSYGSHPQPSYPPSYTPPPAPPSYGLPPAPRPGPPPGPSSRPLSGSPPLSRHGPPSISTLPVPGRSHPSLPPRPPQSNRNVHEPPRDHRNKKKHERHNRNRDNNRQKKPPSHSRPPDQKVAVRNHRTDYKAPDASKPPTTPLPHEQSPQKTLPKTIPEIPKIPEIPEIPKIPEIPEIPKIPEILEVPEIPEIPVTAPGHKRYDAAEPQAEPPTKVDEPPKDPSETEEGEWEERALPKEPEATHIPDEAARPLPANHSPQVLLPRKRDANCTESQFVKPGDLEEYTKPIHEKPYWTAIQLDPIAQDDKLSGDDPSPKVPIGGTQVDRSGSESGDASEQRRKHGYARDHTPEERPSKRQRSNSPANHSPGSTRDYDIPEKLRDSFRPRRRKVHRSDDSDKRSTDVPTTAHRRTPDRMQLYEREPSRSRSPSSRRSSVSNASSGLDSLEAELLGRPDKAKSPEDINKRRQSSGNSNKPKKRQPRLDSAYSRRW